MAKRTTVNGSGDPNKGDMSKTWAYSDRDKGWYVASWTWQPEYAEELRAKGYHVQQAVEEPTERPGQMTIAEVYGEIEIK